LITARSKHERHDACLRQDELGGTEVLKLIDVPIPEPGMREIVARLHAAGANPDDVDDVMARQSGLFVGEPPSVLGWDVSGMVETVGLGVTIYQPGDEVFGMLPFPHGDGAYAQYVVAPSPRLRSEARPP
jgi:NADPH:quinone reductase-like Zn-dependent oxidoreductase